jgi:hypothetical protein
MAKPATFPASRSTRKFAKNTANYCISEGVSFWRAMCCHGADLSEPRSMVMDSEP